MRIGLVSCTKLKLDSAAPARELYQPSDLFRKAFAYAEAHYDKVFILSAKYGLVSPGKILEPYDESLNDMGKQQRDYWAWKVYNQLVERGLLFPGSTEIYFHAGRKYRDRLIELIEKYWRGIELKTPLEGLGIGQQKAWYKERL